MENIGAGTSGVVIKLVEGHVFDWRTGAPVATMRCEIGIRAKSGAPSWDASNVAISDADGRVTLDGVAAGSIAVGCMIPNIFVTPGAAALTLAEGQVGSAEVPVVERNQESSPGHLGAALNMRGFLTAQVIFIERAVLRIGRDCASATQSSASALRNPRRGGHADCAHRTCSLPVSCSSNLPSR